MLVKVAVKILAHVLSVISVVYTKSLSSERRSVDGIKILFSALIFLACANLCFPTSIYNLCPFLNIIHVKGAESLYCT